MRLDGGQVRLRGGQSEGELQLNTFILVVTEASVHRGGGHWGWVGTRASGKAPKTLGLKVGLAVIQTLGKRMTDGSFSAESPLGNCRVKEAGCLSPIIQPDLRRRGQAPPGGREASGPALPSTTPLTAGLSPSHTAEPSDIVGKAGLRESTFRS